MAIFEFCWYICDDLTFLTLSAEPWYGTVLQKIAKVFLGLT